MSGTVTLALKYRPRTFNDVVGQKSVRLILDQMVKQDKVPTGLLFDGVRGTGKTTSGRILAAAVNCTSELSKPCGACPHCNAIFAGNSLDVIEIDAASSGNVGDIRQLTETLRYSVGGSKRVVLLDEAHSMSREAFNALLKTLEEPPPDTIFILLTTEPGKILETVLSRLMAFEFRRISTADIVERLNHIRRAESIPMDDALVLTIAERSSGGMRDAIMTLDQMSRIGVTSVAEFAERMGESDYGPEIVAAMVTGNPANVFASLDAQLVRTGDSGAIASQLVGVLRDVLILRSGGVVARQGSQLESRQALAARIEPERALAGLRVLWDLKTKVRLGDDPRTLLDLAAVMVTEKLGTSALPTAASAAPQRMTLAGMRSA